MLSALFTVLSIQCAVCTVYSGLVVVGTMGPHSISALSEVSHTQLSIPQHTAAPSAQCAQCTVHSVQSSSHSSDSWQDGVAAEGAGLSSPPFTPSPPLCCLPFTPPHHLLPFR